MASAWDAAARLRAILVRRRQEPARGIQTQDAKLWVAVPPARMIYRIDPKTWMVEHMFPTVGYRPHGVGIETPDARYLWESDTNMGAFFKRDMITGDVVDSIQLPEGSPFPHGMSVWKGYIYWTDDIGGHRASVPREDLAACPRAITSSVVTDRA